MTDEQDVQPPSAAPTDASGTAAPSEGDLADLWSSWIASPDDPATRDALVEAVAETVAVELSEALDEAADGKADDATTDAATDGPAGGTAATGSSGEDASDRILDEQLTYGSDDIVLEQLDAMGAAENVNDGMSTSDGTLDYDWT